ncbi:unnamed protein product [Rotaria magnacalcarata]
MSDEDENEIEMIVDKKSRFSRYRTRIRERKQLDINETLTTDNLNETPENEACAFDQQMGLDDGITSTLKHDEYNPASDSVLRKANKQISPERHNDNDNDNNYEDEVDELYRFYNDRNNIGDGNDGNKVNDDEYDNDNEYNDEDEDDSIEESPDFQNNFYDNYFETERLSDATELSVMLFFTWKRYNISKAAVNDICRIINTFNIPNMPKDFRAVMRHLKRNNPTLLGGNHFYICPSCGNRCANASKCNLTGCQSSNSPVRTPASVVVFPLVSQISSILERETLIIPTYELNQCDDLPNSQCAQEVARKEKQINPARNNVTLTLNTDGVLLKRISRSLWITCACINELPRKTRYDINNMLICSMSTGDDKPKKDEYSTILQDIVNELKFLEHVGFDVLLPSTVKTHNRTYTHFYAFTITAVCDKPAQAIMMNIKDPTGFFSCGWCCIPGETHSSNSRCFVNNSRTPAILRNNMTYDHFMKILTTSYAANDSSKDRACGHAGPCALRQLTYFEIGSSFCFDSLHGLYAGVFKKLMHLWLDTVRVDYSIKKQFSCLEKLLKCIRYPTTNRLPRALKYYTTWKTNEFRMTLLFGYKQFEQVMKKKYYEHFRLLVYAAIFSEARILTTTRLDQIKHLLNKFLDEFPMLYGASNCVSIVQSLSHVHQSLAEFGPIHNYSTFNFESTVGIIQLKTTKDIIFIIDQAEIVGFDTFSLDRIEYVNDFLVYTKHSNPPTIISINYKSIKEKVAYRKDPKLKTLTEFYIFPNLKKPVQKIALTHSVNSDEEVTDDEVNSNVWSEIESESDGEFLEDHGIVEQVTPTSEDDTINPIDCYRHFYH